MVLGDALQGPVARVRQYIPLHPIHVDAQITRMESQKLSVACMHACYMRSAV